jgi:hypothetical protein
MGISERLESDPHVGPNEVVGSFWRKRERKGATDIRVAVRVDDRVYCVRYEGFGYPPFIRRRSSELVKKLFGKELYREVRKAAETEFFIRYNRPPANSSFRKPKK